MKIYLPSTEDSQLMFINLSLFLNKFVTEQCNYFTLHLNSVSSLPCMM